MSSSSMPSLRPQTLDPRRSHEKEDGTGVGATKGITPPNLDLKDSGGGDSSMAFSPQWLFAKPSDNKPSNTPLPSASSRGGSVIGGFTENAGIGKEKWKAGRGAGGEEGKRDWWRTANAAEREGSRWGEDERDTAGRGREVRWKDAEREVGDGEGAKRGWGDGVRKVEGREDYRREKWAEGEGGRSFDLRKDRDPKWSGRRSFGEERGRGRGIDKDGDGGELKFDPKEPKSVWEEDRKRRPSDEKGELGGAERARDKEWVPAAWERSTDGEKLVPSPREPPLNRGGPVASQESAPRDAPKGDKWRPHSIVGRGRGLGEAPPAAAASPAGAPPPSGFTYARGSSGRGRGRGVGFGADFVPGPFPPSSSQLASTAAHPDRWEPSLPPSPFGSRPPIGASFSSESDGIGNGIFKYPRGKLLDIYRRNLMLRPQDLSSPLVTFEPAPNIVVEESLQPIALSQPSKDELEIRRGMESGEITGSGAVHLGGGGRDLPARDSEHERVEGEDASHQEEKGAAEHRHGSTNAEKKALPWRSSQARGESALTSKGPQREDERWSRGRDRGDDISTSDPKVEGKDHRENTLQAESRKESLKVPQGESLQSSRVEGVEQGEGEVPIGQIGSKSREGNGGAAAMPGGVPPEKLFFFYTDPQGDVQGPFLGADLVTWFDDCFFGLDLPVRLASAPSNAAFLPLGTVMPHLKPAPRLPPGFAQPKTEAGKEFIPEEMPKVEDLKPEQQANEPDPPLALNLAADGLDHSLSARRRMAAFPKVEEDNSFAGSQPGIGAISFSESPNVNAEAWSKPPPSHEQAQAPSTGHSLGAFEADHFPKILNGPGESSKAFAPAADGWSVQNTDKLRLSFAHETRALPLQLPPQHHLQQHGEGGSFPSLGGDGGRGGGPMARLEEPHSMPSHPHSDAASGPFPGVMAPPPFSAPPFSSGLMPDASLMHHHPPSEMHTHPHSLPHPHAMLHGLPPWQQQQQQQHHQHQLIADQAGEQAMMGLPAQRPASGHLLHPGMQQQQQHLQQQQPQHLPQQPPALTAQQLLELLARAGIPKDVPLQHILSSLPPHALHPSLLPPSSAPNSSDSAYHGASTPFTAAPFTSAPHAGHSQHSDGSQQASDFRIHHQQGNVGSFPHASAQQVQQQQPPPSLFFDSGLPLPSHASLSFSQGMAGGTSVDHHHLQQQQQHVYKDARDASSGGRMEGVWEVDTNGQFIPARGQSHAPASQEAVSGSERSTDRAGEQALGAVFSGSLAPPAPSMDVFGLDSVVQSSAAGGQDSGHEGRVGSSEWQERSGVVWSLEGKESAVGKDTKNGESGEERSESNLAEENEKNKKHGGDKEENKKVEAEALQSKGTVESSPEPKKSVSGKKAKKGKKVSSTPGEAKEEQKSTVKESLDAAVVSSVSDKKQQASEQAGVGLSLESASVSKSVTPTPWAAPTKLFSSAAPENTGAAVRKSLAEIQREEEEAAARRAEEDARRREEFGALPAAPTFAGPWAVGVAGRGDGHGGKGLKDIVEEEERRARMKPVIDLPQDLLVERGSGGGGQDGVDSVVLRDVFAEEILGAVAASSLSDQGRGSGGAMAEVELGGGLEGGSGGGEDGFVEAKDSKKGKKKGNKVKVQGVSTAASASSAINSEPSALPGSVTGAKTEKSKRGAGLSVEDVSAAPPAPSLADFLLLPGDQSAQVAAQSPMAWSRPAVVTRPAVSKMSLKEIQAAEEERKRHERALAERQMALAAAAVPSPGMNAPILRPAAAAVWGPGAGGGVVAGGGQSPAMRGGSVLPAPTAAEQRKQRAGARTLDGDDEEMFWDYGSKDVGGKGAQKGKQDMESFTASHSLLQALPQAKKGAAAKPGTSDQAAATAASNSAREALKFRQWCEGNIRKITGTSDMTLLNFCMSLETADEAGHYLEQYLGTSPAVRAFKNEFLQRKAVLPPPIAHLAFPMSDAVVRGPSDASPVPSSTATSLRRTVNGSSSAAKEPPLPRAHEPTVIEGGPESGNGEKGSGEVGGGKRKSKKAKQKVDPSLLGFSVTSNRIMKGEIQRVEDL